MPLVNTKEMFEKAYEGGYAIGAFNVNDMEIMQGIVAACKELNSPVILQVSGSARKYAHHAYLYHMVQAAIEETGLPIALHLDHGANFELCKDCIDGGFSSVMIDGSHLPYEENVAETRKVVEYAHAHGVTVEGELGQLAGIEDEVSVEADKANYTDPEQVQDFVTRTGVDSLAIAIGTSHGAFKFKPGQKPQLRFDILQEVMDRLPKFRAARRVFGHAGICCAGQSVRRPDGRCDRHSGGYAPQGGVHGGLQDQCGLGSASGDDGRRTQASCGESDPF